MSVTIRPVNVENDEEDVFLLYQAMTIENDPSLPAATDYDAWRVISAYVKTVLRQQFCAVAEVDGNVVGFCMGILEERTPPRDPKHTLLVEGFYLTPEHRRGWTGWKLVDAVLTWGKGQGCRFAECKTDEKNRRALERGGFALYRIEMRKDLTGGA